MTNKYIQTQVSTETYQRCEEIRIFNPYQEVPTVMFMEEQVLTRPNGSVLHDKVGTMTKLITDINETFPVYNPVTQTKVGQDSSIGQLYALIWSVYMHEATKRDAAQAKAESEQASRVQAQAAQDEYNAAVAALNAAFTASDNASKDAAVALADSKSTDEEKAVVMADYRADRDTKSAMLATNLAALEATYKASVLTSAAAASAAAQAAYDAVMNQ